MAACAGDDPDRNIEVLIGQLVKILQDGEEVRLSKRAGTIVTLEELIELIGVDAAALLAGPLPHRLAADARRRRDHPAGERQPGLLRAVRARADRVAAAQLPATSADPTSTVDPALLAHEKEGDLLRALAEFPRVVAAAAQLREPHRVARYLEETAPLPSTGSTTPAACCRRVTRSSSALHARPAGAGERDPHRACRTAWTCSESGHRSGCEGARGGLGARRGLRPRAGLAARAGDANALVPHLWSSTARKTGTACWRSGEST